MSQSNLPAEKAADFLSGLFRTAFVVIFFAAAVQSASGQQGAADYDSTYYASYPSNLYGRIYLSEKYAAFSLKGTSAQSRLHYLSNSDLKVGAGLTYRRISVNVAYGFGFMNRDPEKGKTRDLDLQTRLYARKWAFDLFGQLYDGFYLSPKGRASAEPSRYYLRPDLSFRLAGISGYRIFNHRRFTLRPAFIQDEQQKRSAGSLLAGGEVLYGQFRADSAFVPAAMSALYDQRQVRSVKVLKAGIGTGYAYTQVFPYNLYLTGSLTANGNLNFIRETGISGEDGRVTLTVDLIYRLAAGYNNGNWSLTAFWLGTRIPVRGDPVGNPYTVNTGNYRLIFTKRLRQSAFTRKLLYPIDLYHRVLDGIRSPAP